MEPDDLKLIRDAKQGDAQAFANLIRSYQNFAYKTVLGVLNNASDADDALQETFLKVHRALPNLRDERTFPSWLARIATRTALDLVRSRAHARTSYDDEIDKHTFVDPGPQVDLRLDLQQALARLSPEHRTVLVLREVQGFDYAAIADILHIPLGTVRSRLFNARAQLRLQLESDGASGGAGRSTKGNKGGARDE